MTGWDLRSIGWLVQGSWGWVPVLTVVVGISAMLQGTANVMARLEMPGAEIPYWLSFILTTVPITIALLRRTVPRGERIALVLLMGIGAAIVGLARTPVAFTGYDALQHLRTAESILEGGHLFEPNPLLTVSPYYPGLEIVTTAVASLAGVDVFAAWVALLVGIRLIFGLGLFLLFEHVGGSARIGALAAAVYMMNPGFTYFHSSFAYESLALPLVPILLLLTAHRASPGTAGWHFALAVAIAVIAAAIVATHHVTSYAALGILLLWSLLHLWMRARDRYDGSVYAVALMVATGVGGWLLGVASATLGYLLPPLDAAVRQVVRLITTGEGRRLFEAASGQLAPYWERVTGILATGIIFAWLPVGIGAVIGRIRSSSLAMVFVILALGMPASLALRLTPTGAEAASRGTAFIWIGLAFVVAYGVLSAREVAAWLARSLQLTGAMDRGIDRVAAPVGAWRAVAGVGFGVLAIGGVIIGTSPATRLPGPFLVSADSRSIDAVTRGLASWMRTELGPDNRIAADRVNRLLLASIGGQYPVFHHSEGIESWQLFVAPEVGFNEERRLRALELDYLVIDRRLSQSLPVLVPFYYEEGEIAQGRHEVPISSSVLAKWDGAAGVARIYDSGDIQVYDVQRLSGGE